jgi:hypothetical protein
MTRSCEANILPCARRSASPQTTPPIVEPTKEKATIKMDGYSDLDRKVSTHTDKVVIGFGVKAEDEDECESEYDNDAEDNDKAIDEDAFANHFFDHCVNADTVTNDNDFSDNGRRTSCAVFCSLLTSEKKRRAIVEGWTCDKCIYQHRYHTQQCAMATMKTKCAMGRR